MSKEAMQQALEALELDEAGCQYAGESTPECITDAITALREALAEQPAQQESVAWRNAALRVGEDLCSVGPFRYYDMTAEQWLDWALSVVTVHEPPRPQAREPLLRTFESLHNINDIVFIVRKDRSVIQGCVSDIIVRATRDAYALSYQVIGRSEVFSQKNVYSDPHDAFSSTYKY